MHLQGFGAGITGCALAWLLVAGPASALQFENGGSFEPSRHERFLAGSFPAAPLSDPDFFLATHEPELTGVGWQTSAPRKKATLISPLHFLNADHYKISGSVTFLDQNGALHSIPVVANVQVAGDIAVGTLEHPVPPGVHVFPVMPVLDAEHDGREVLYIGASPGSSRFAAGRTAIEFSSQSSNRLNSSFTSAEFSGDRVYGTSGDSGSPSFFDEGGVLALVGHHFGGHNDQYLGYGPACDAVDDHLAADGHLLDMVGQGWLGDPADAGLVVTRLSAAGEVELSVKALGQPMSRTIRLHDFSGLGVEVTASASGSGFALRDPASGSLVDVLSILLHADGRGTALEVVFTSAAWGEHRGALRLDDGGAVHDVPLSGHAIDSGVRPVAVSVEPGSQSGSSGGGGLPGDTLRYAVVVGNEDAGADAPAELQLSARGAPGWSLLFDPPTLALGPGERGSSDLFVTPAAGAPPATYSFQVESRDSQETAHDASASGSYEVTSASQDLTPPTVPTGVTASGNRKRSTLSWSASQDDVGVAGYRVMRDGATIGYTEDPSYPDGPFEPGRLYVYSVSAYDLAGNTSPESEPLTLVNGKPATDSGDDPGSGDDGTWGGICPPSHRKEVGRHCRDGIDNDCDGLIDASDPDC